MNLIRFFAENMVRYGVVENNTIKELTADFFTDLTFTKRCFNMQDVKVLAPVEPSKIICVGLNYKKHAKEMSLDLHKNPIIFIKPTSAICNPLDNIILPNCSKQVDFEAELAIVISKTCKNVKKEFYKDYILGYTCFNDVTARDIQSEEGQWTRAKGFDTFAPIGPVIVTDFNTNSANVKSILNGKIMQNDNINNFIFGIPEIIEFVSHSMTLNKGDVISTGTPSGISKLSDGDTITIEIDGIPSLINYCIKEN